MRSLQGVEDEAHAFGLVDHGGDLVGIGVGGDVERGLDAFEAMFSGSGQDGPRHHEAWADRHGCRRDLDLLCLADPGELGQQSKGQRSAEVGERRGCGVIAPDRCALVAGDLELVERRHLELAARSASFDIEREAHATVGPLDLEGRFAHCRTLVGHDELFGRSTAPGSPRPGDGGRSDTGDSRPCPARPGRPVDDLVARGANLRGCGERRVRYTSLVWGIVVTPCAASSATAGTGSGSRNRDSSEGS